MQWMLLVVSEIDVNHKTSNTYSEPIPSYSGLRPSWKEVLDIIKKKGLFERPKEEGEEIRHSVRRCVYWPFGWGKVKGWHGWGMREYIVTFDGNFRRVPRDEEVSP